MTDWKVVKTATTDDGHTVELRYAEFGKGRAKVRNWQIFRDGKKAGYAVNESDAAVNFDRVCAGFVHNPSTGNYETAND